MSILGKEWKIAHRDPTLPAQEKILRLKEDHFSTKDELFQSNPMEHIHDPFLLHDMEKACERIEEAIAKKERIVVFGDYDVDGVTATTCLVRTILKLGGQCSYRIPHRLKDGYSLKEYFLDELKELDVKVVITVDNGISAAKQIAYANELGMDIIVTDHHEPPAKDQLPVAHSIINPKLEGCEYPFKELSGSAVAMKLCVALCERNMKDDPGYDQFLEKLYQVAGIGIVADCMPLIGENRAIVKIALKTMRHSPLRGVEQLMEIAGGSIRNLRASDIAFTIGPRLNAAGRLDSAYDALHLFLNQSKTVDEIAKKLHVMNGERRSMTQQFLEEAEAQLKEEELHEIIIVCSPNWNSGINGLVASRLVEKYARPAIVLSVADGEMVGSCRSISNFGMVDALRQVEDILEHYGGHHAAAGLTLKEEHFFEFVERMRGVAKLWLHDIPLISKLKLDTDIALHELSFETLAFIERMEPYGIGNPKPTFLLENVQLENLKTIGATKDHLSFQVGDIRGVSFGTGQYINDLLGKPLDVACSLERNDWKGNTYLQLHAKDFSVRQ